LDTKDKSIAKRKVNTNFFPCKVLKNPPHLMFRKVGLYIKMVIGESHNTLGALVGFDTPKSDQSE